MLTDKAYGMWREVLKHFFVIRRSAYILFVRKAKVDSKADEFV